MRPALINFFPVLCSETELSVRSEPPTMQIMSAITAGSCRSWRKRLRYDVATWCTPSLPNLGKIFSPKSCAIHISKESNSHPAKNGIRHHSLKPALSLTRRALCWNLLGRRIGSVTTNQPLPRTQSLLPGQETKLTIASPTLYSPTKADLYPHSPISHSTPNH